MGSCFKFKMCRKRAYDFNNQPYETSPAPAGTYRASTVDVEGWDPNEALSDHTEEKTETKIEQVNGDAQEETTQDAIVVSCPSNSDVMFAGNLATEEPEEEEKTKKGKSSKSNKKKKEKEKEKEKQKEKEKKSKKEKNKKSKSKKKKGKDDDSDSENEMTEKEDKKDQEKEKDKTDEPQDISNMETLPRDEKHVVSVVETTTVMAGGEPDVHEISVTEAVGQVDETLDQVEKDVDIVTSTEEVVVQNGVSSAKIDASEIYLEEKKPEVHIVSTTIVTETNGLAENEDTSPLDSSLKTYNDNEISAEVIEGNGHQSFEQTEEKSLSLYPEPEEQIDIIKSVTEKVVNGDAGEVGGTVIEKTTKTVQETTNYGTTVTVSKVITETVEKHGDVSETVSNEINEELAKF